MRLEVFPSKLSGEIAAPPSKSVSHRLLICAGLAGGESVIDNVAYSQDVLATLDCLEALGAGIKREGPRVIVTGNGGRLAAGKALDCRESGSTLRFFVPVALTSTGEFIFTGSQRLMQRPLSVYEDICRKIGAKFELSGDRLAVRGPIAPGEYAVPGDVSSQFITGLLFALPLLPGESRVRLTGKLQSAPYTDLTLDAQRRSGIEIIREPDGWRISGSQRYKPFNGTVEGDCSNAAFLEGTNLLGHRVKVTGIAPDTLQGDRVYRNLFDKLREGRPEISVADCPDLAPVLMALAAANNGATLTDTARLRIKESDRGEAMKEELEKLGARVTVEENRITVESANLKRPKVPLDSHNDHRIAMAAFILLTVTGGEITGAEAVNKSYPGFYEAMTALGAEVRINEA